MFTSILSSVEAHVEEQKENKKTVAGSAMHSVYRLESKPATVPKLTPMMA